jgi:ketosteroid isomerase-like protein
MRLGIAGVALLWLATVTHAQSLDDQLRATTQALLDAVAPGDRTTWEAQLDPDFIHMDEAGVVRTRTEFLNQLTPLPAGLVGRIQIDMWRLAIHGDVAVAVYELQEHLDYHGQLLRSRFRSMDTWQRTQGRWRLISEHTAAVLKDPPAITLSQNQFCEYAGTYSLTAQLQTTITCTADGLESTRTGQKPVIYRAEVLDVFFVPGQPRTRRIFLRDVSGQVQALVDRREGEDVRWRKVP